MRSLNVNGELTRWTVIGEAERSVTLLCIPAFTELSLAMQSATECL